MNYYPNNFYQNYPYGNTYPQYSQAPTATSSFQTQQLPQTGLQGKVVDGEDVVKATEVPFGGYGIFPKADLNEIYVKSWNNDGTTKIITYKPVIPQSTEAVVDTQAILLNKIQNIENKLDNITQYYNTSTTIEKKKEEIKEPVTYAY